MRRNINMVIGATTHAGFLDLPAGLPKGIIIFAHGSGSSRLSKRNQFVAETLVNEGFATLLFDLLTEDEDQTYENRFDIPLLAARLTQTAKWVMQQDDLHDLPIGYFGASTGAAAALISAANNPEPIGAVVSRGGRPDLALESLPRVKAPTLLIVGGRDEPVIGMNQVALRALQCEKKLVTIPGATHLFEEPGTLEQVAGLAQDWFTSFLTRQISHMRAKTFIA